MASIDRVLFRTLLREEWRLHAVLFGGKRFFTFPLVIALLTAGAGIGLALAGSADGTLFIGIRGLALAFGLYAGTAGFVGTDMLERLLDDLSPVLGTVETLPLSPRRLLGIFLVKDGLFYAAVFLAPMALGVGALEGATAGATGAIDPGSLADFEVGTLVATALVTWFELTVIFALGMAVTVTAIGLRTRHVPGSIVGLAFGLVAVASWFLGALPALLVEATPAALAGGGILAVILSAGALALYDPAYQPPSRTATDRFAGLTRRVPYEDGLVAKSLLDLGRSSGGYLKPLVSVALLLAVVAGLFVLIERVFGVTPPPGVFFGAVLALSAFTTYNWLTQFDALESYRVLPVSITAVFRAKRLAFAVVGLPTALLGYLVAVVAFPTSIVDAVVGATLCLGLSLYFYGVTVYLAGFDPNEFLFDATRFAGFSAAVAAVLVPLLVASFALAMDVGPSWLPFAGVPTALVLAVVGYALADRAGVRWEEALRSE